MRIKKIDITGFKSFKDSISIPFDTQISAVVGPNGCGKSNIVDAALWAMGEQSPKHLRGESMGDVIFNGSEKHGPTGMAEVILTFENDGRLPPPYDKCSEISVGRRLFRSGESEYLINKTPCRLMDITDIFLGTGVGTKSYSIVEQGKIGMLVSARPTDRRLFLEEAAGISKYRIKKAAAIRKMNATEQNLLRLRDILGELQSRLRSLNSQAKKAERYKKYCKERENIDLWISSHNFLDLASHMNLVERTSASLKEQMVELEARLSQEEADVARIRLELTAEEQTNSDLNERLYRTTSKIELFERDINHFQQENGELTERIRQSNEEMERFKVRSLNLHEEEAALGRDFGLFESQLSEKRLELKERAAGLAELRTLRDRCSARIEASLMELSNLRTGIESGKVEKRAIEQRLEALALQREQNVQERIAHIDDLEDLEGRYKEAVEAHSLKSETKIRLKQKYQETVAHFEELKEQALHLEAQNISLRQELQDRRSRLASLRELKERYEGYGQGVRTIMKEKKEHNGIRGLVADVIEANPEYEKAVEAVLGEKLQYIIVDSHKEGLQAIEHLSAESSGRSSFIPASPRVVSELCHQPDQQRGVISPMLKLLNFDQEYESLVHSLLGDVLLVDDLDNALQIWNNNGHHRTIVTKNGEVLDQVGVITGGTQEGDGWGLLQKKREIRELIEEIARREEVFNALELQRREVKNQLAALEGEVDELRGGLHRQEISLVNQERDVERLEADQRRLESAIRDLARNRQALDRECYRLSEDRRVIDEEVDYQSSRIGAFKESLEAQRGELSELNERMEEASHFVTNIKVAIASLDEKHQNTGASLKRIARDQEESKEQASRRKQLIADAEKRIEENNRRRVHTSEELEVLVGKSRKMEEDLSIRRNNYETKANALQVQEAGLKGLRDGQQEVSKSLSDREKDVIRLGSDMTYLKEKTRERYKIDLSEVIIDFHNRPLAADSDRERLQYLNEVIERMQKKGVNVTAIEEFQELKEREEFLTEQEEDLSTSMNSLKRTIARINRTSRERFKTTFEEVNRRFKEIFPGLFGGGKAYLSLTDSEDLLESGVEIAAQPPGKKLQSIDLLSGGEKALTAVALLFALFLTKSSPLCLLDEVDAPLDDANIGRFNEVVKEMSNHAQIIIITHNKQTMEICDRLFGITMEEPGVSKVVSVEMKQAAS